MWRKNTNKLATLPTDLNTLSDNWLSELIVPSKLQIISLLWCLCKSSVDKWRVPSATRSVVDPWRLPDGKRQRASGENGGERATAIKDWSGANPRSLQPGYWCGYIPAAGLKSNHNRTSYQYLSKCIFSAANYYTATWWVHAVLYGWELWWQVKYLKYMWQILSTKLAIHFYWGANNTLVYGESHAWSYILKKHR